MRTDKFLSQMKYCTRSEAKAFLKEHAFIVNGKLIINPKENIEPEQSKITLDGENVFYKNEIHLMMYKPKGYLSANHDSMHKCITSLIKEPYHRFDFSIAGRLDLDAEGLLILTTDGTLIHEITSPKKHLPKVYEVTLNLFFSHHHELLNGVSILDGKNQPYLAKAIDIQGNDDCVHITIDEGKFHQVKRMFEAVGYDVINLKRIQIGNLRLGDLKPGEYIEITKETLYD